MSIQRVDCKGGREKRTIMQEQEESEGDGQKDGEGKD